MVGLSVVPDFESRQTNGWAPGRTVSSPVWWLEVVSLDIYQQTALKALEIGRDDELT